MLHTLLPLLINESLIQLQQMVETLWNQSLSQQTTLEQWGG